MKSIIKDSVAKAMSYSEYNLLFKYMVMDGQTTGDSTPEKIEYTKLNWSRSKRLDKTIELTEEQKKCFSSIKENQTWLVITEPWCGDAAQSLPYFNIIAETSENITLSILLRDENPEIMDVFLTDGARSIPKLIILDKNLELITHWGPRSTAAAEVVNNYIQTHGKIEDQLKTDLQIWYNKNNGKAILNELQEIANCESLLR